MSAADVTPEQMADLRRLVDCGFPAVGRALDALEAAWKERDVLRAQIASSAPVAVEVPELTQDSFRDCHAEDHFQEFDEATTIANINAWFRDRIKPIDPSRILKDGEREELEILRKVAKIIDDKRNAQWERRERRGAGACQRMPDEIDNLLCDWYEIQAKREYDALRSGEAGEGSGREGA